MNNNVEIKLQLPDINELLRLPVSLYNKRTLETDAEEYIVEALKWCGITIDEFLLSQRTVSERV